MSAEFDYGDEPAPRWYQGMKPASWAVLAVVLILPLIGLIVIAAVAVNRSGDKAESKTSKPGERNPKYDRPQAGVIEKGAKRTQKDVSVSSRLPPDFNRDIPKNRPQLSPNNEPQRTEVMNQRPALPERSERDRRRVIEEGETAGNSRSQQLERTPEKSIPVPGTLLDEVVTGYETRRLLGFTFLLSTQAISEGQKEKGKPFQALEKEFDGLVHVLPPIALKHLRGILIWIEWDKIDRRNPNVLAKYYGGRIWKLDGSSHPLKSNAVEVLSLKRLTEEKAAARKKSRLVLLHELAHAVHHLVLGLDNSDVEFAYNQAMDRRLYDKVEDAFGNEDRAYAATSAAEYFAELTCAYLDRCLYFPFTRTDLREHDPTGYRLMQKVWGNDKPPAGQKRQGK